jgi:hypothetical protein
MFMNFFGQRQVSQPIDDTITATYGSIASFLGMKRKVSSMSDDSSHKMPKYSKNDLEFYSRCFANYIRPFTVSPAEIQAFFLSCRDDNIEVVAHKGNDFLEFIKSLRPSLSKSTGQPHPVEQLVVITSQTTPFRSNVQDTIVPSILRATPTLPVYEQKAIEEEVSDPSSEEYEQDELSQEDTNSNRHESENEEVIEEEAFAMSDGSDETREDEELTTEDEETGDEEEENQTVEITKNKLREQYDDNDDLNNDEKIENRSESCAEVESNVKITAEVDFQGEKLLEINPQFEIEAKATSISKTEAEFKQQSQATGLPSASDSETIPPPEDIDVSKDSSNELKEVSPDDHHTSTENQAESEGNRSDSEQSEMDLTPTGKQVECMPFPSPKKQEKVVADVLKHKMSRGLSFMEATDLIFKEGIQGVDAAVINRVLGEKSVTPIKRTVNRKPIFRAKGAGHKFSRRLKRERSKQKMISDENEWRDEKSDANLQREEESSSLEPAFNKDLTGKARKKVHYDNESPLRKFASSQKHTSLHKAANLPTRSRRKSLAKSPNRRTTKTDPEDSSEYDSGTERARKELDDFLQRKASTSNKDLKAEKK